MITKTARLGISVITLLSFFGCATKQPVFKNCENTFVLSDGRTILLFEHDKKDVRFNLLKQYSNWSSRGAFLDCQRNIIVSPYAYKGVEHDKGGVTIFTLHNDQSKDYEIHESPHGHALGRYKNGVLLGTMLMQKEKIKEGAGYIPPAQIFMDDEGILWNSYTYTILFDLDQKKVVKYYANYIGPNVIIGDVMRAQAAGSISEIDLNTGHLKKLFEPISFQEMERGSSKKDPLSFSLSAFTAWGDLYMVPVPRRDAEASAGYEKGAIYKLESEKWVKQVNLPDKMASLYVALPPNYGNLAWEDPFYMVAVDEHIYVFTRQSKKVFRFHTKTKELKEYDLKLPIPDDWYINSIGYTKENFIIPVSKREYNIGGIFVVKRDFSKVSDMLKVPMVMINTTTQEDVTTDSNEN